MLRDMYTVLSLLNRLVDSLFPPPGGPMDEVDVAFEDLVARFNSD